MDTPIYISIFFTVITLFLVYIIGKGYHYSLKKSNTAAKKPLMIYMLLVTLFIGLQLLFAKLGWFNDMQSMPPKPIFLVVICFLTMVVILTRKKTKVLLQQLPFTWLLYIQIFRVFVEIVIWLLHKEKLVPVQMTFEGYNIDIVPAILCPLVGYLVFQKKVLSKGWAIFINVFGLIVVTNIVIIAILSTPASNITWEDPIKNIIIGYWPMIWLPGFVAPLAYFFHFLSIKQLLQKTT